MINVIGLGYIGLPTALMFAARGNKVVGTDISEDKITDLKNGILPFEEKGIQELYDEAVANNIQFTTDYLETDMYIITVPTPYNRETKRINPAYVIDATLEATEKALDGATIVIESTVSPGTIDRHVRPIIEEAEKKLNKKFYLVHAPERILPGNMIHELRHNSRTIGSDNLEAARRVEAIYETFCESEIVITDIRTAEMSKVIENTYRDINIAFANELAKISRYDDLNVYEIIRIANKHPRVNILNPGPGVGGHCISVDPWFLVGDYPEHTNLIQQARGINDSMPAFTLKRIHDIMLEEGIEDINRVGLYGLTYKPNVDDTRESPTLQLLEKQRQSLAPELKVFDPMVRDHNITQNQFESFEEFMEDIDLVVIMVGHDHLKEKMGKFGGKIVLDMQNVFPESEKTYYI